MKSIIISLALLALLVRLSDAQSFIDIPDGPFEHALIDMGIDIDGDTSISYAEAEAVNYIDVSGKHIWSLDGIEAFTNLDTLICSSNDIYSMDFSNNEKLRYLDCNHNQLTSLDVSGNSLLEEVYCSNNQLTSLLLSDNPLLERVDCSNNQLTSLLLPAGSLSELNLKFACCLPLPSAQIIK